MLARAARRISRSPAASIELKAMDITALDFPDHSFDAAIATFLLCVLPEEIALMKSRRRIAFPKAQDQPDADVQ